MVPFDRFAVVLDACTMFPMLVRDVLLTLAAHEFFSPKWSPRIREEWTRNLVARMTDRDGGDVARSKVGRIAAAVETAFPDALVATELPESPVLDPVDAKDRHVVVTAMVAKADAIVTFNISDFAAPHLSQNPRRWSGANILVVEHERRDRVALISATPVKSPRFQPMAQT